MNRDYTYETEDSPRGDRWLCFGLFLLFVELYLPYLGANLENLRWLLFSLTVIVFASTRLGGLREPAVKGLFFLFMANALLRVVSVLWSPDQIYTAMRAASLLLMLVFIAILAGEVVSRNIARSVLFVIALWAVGLILLSGLVYFAGWKQLPWNGYPVYRGINADRFAGIFGNPNQLGICAAVSFPILIGFFMENKRRVYLLAVAALAVFLLYKSGSRAGMLSIVAGTLGMLLVLREESRRLILVSIIALPIAAVAIDIDKIEQGVLGFISRSDATEFDVEEIADNRLYRWELGWKSIRKHPTLGQGYGIGGISDSANPEFTEFDQGYPLHNSFLQVMQENGFVGLVLFLVMLLPLYYRALTVRMSGASRHPHLLAGCMGVLIGGVVSAFFESWLFSVGNLGCMPYWVCVGIVWALTSPDAQQDEVDEFIKDEDWEDLSQRTEQELHMS